MAATKRKTPPKKPATTATTQAKTENKAKTPLPPAGPNWKYYYAIKGLEDTHEITPEVQAIVDKLYPKIKLHPDAKGKLTNNTSKLYKKGMIAYDFKGNDETYDSKKRFKDEKGRTFGCLNYWGITVFADPETKKLKEYEFYHYIQDEKNPLGKKIIVESGKL